MFKNLGIGTRLGVGFAIVLVLMVVQAVISYSRMATLQNEIDDMVRDKFPKTVWAKEIVDNVNVIARAYMGALSAYVFSEMLASGGRGTAIDPQAYVEAYVDTLLTGMSPAHDNADLRSGTHSFPLGALAARPSATASQLQR